MYGDRGNIEIAALWIVFGLLVNAVIDGWYLSLNKPDFDVICKKDSWKLEEMYNPTGVLCFLSHEPQPVPVDCQWNTISDKLFFD